MIGGQILIIYVGGAAFNITGLTGEQWGYSIFFGSLSIPIGAIIRLIPDEFIQRFVLGCFSPDARTRGPEVTIEDEEQRFYFPGPLNDVKEELSFLKRIKGGRLNNLVFAMEHPSNFLPRSRSGSRSRSRSNSSPGTPNEPREGSIDHDSSRSRGYSRSNRSRSNSALGATAVMAGIIAGSVAGWSPIERSRSDADSLRLTQSRPRSELDPNDSLNANTSGATNRL
jgi:Ca2+-transporting ATPase